MKKEIIETSKGMFVLIDKNNDWHFGEKFNYYGANKFDAINIADVNKNFSFRKSFKLSEITEEQASKIVDEFLHNANDGTDYGDQEVYKDYITDEIYLTDPKESLHSLLESKGIHLFRNPIPPFHERLEDFIEAEEKTFYNPYIFKI